MKRDELIKSLSKDCDRVSRFPTLFSSLLFWLIVSFAVLVLVVMVMFKHPVLTPSLLSINNGLILLTSLLAGYSAFKTATPRESSWKNYLFLFPLSVWVVKAGYGLLLHYDSSQIHLRECFCTSWLVLVFLGPALLAFAIIRKGASTQPFVTGALIAISATLFSLWGISITCPAISPTHILVWHVLPSFILSLLGIVLGFKLKHW